MPKIRIISVPPGQAPEEVRRQWVGVEISLLPESNAAVFSSSVLGGDPDSRNVNGYLVEIDEAIQALGNKKTMDATRAVKWWTDWRKNTSIGMYSHFFSFSKDVCELVS